MAHYYGLRRTGLTQEECAVIVAQSILRPGTLDPIHPKVILCWMREFVDRDFETFSPQSRKSRWILEGHTELQEKAKSWIRIHARQKGKATMKVADFRKFVNEDLLLVGTAAVPRPP